MFMLREFMKHKIYIHFNYQLHNGYVPFGAWIKLTYYSMLLLIRRFLRMCKRIVMYLNRYLPIIVCVIIFELVIIPLGIDLGKYNSWIDGFWDLRNFMLTSIVISIVVGILNIETKRHKELRKQYSVYESFKYDSTNFIVSLCKVADVFFAWDVFQTEKNFQTFYEELQNIMKRDFSVVKHSIIVDSNLLYSTKKLPRTVVIIIYFEQYLRKLDKISEALLSHDFEGRIEHAVEQVDYIYNELQAERLLIEKQKDNYSDMQLLKFIDSISRAIYPAVADVRNPWRWDTKINTKMSEIINSFKNS